MGNMDPKEGNTWANHMDEGSPFYLTKKEVQQ